MQACRKPPITDIMSVSKKSDNSEGRVLNFCLVQFAKKVKSITL